MSKTEDKIAERLALAENVLANQMKCVEELKYFNNLKAIRISQLERELMISREAELILLRERERLTRELEEAKKGDNK